MSTAEHPIIDDTDEYYRYLQHTDASGQQDADLFDALSTEYGFEQLAEAHRDNVRKTTAWHTSEPTYRFLNLYAIRMGTHLGFEARVLARRQERSNPEAEMVPKAVRHCNRTIPFR